ncbi:PDGLE domain-containing protein [Bifidobacterium sp. MA2]|uniref:PDGLE domain-containing protein n=1 Tax=Bifidobacterium santillanense TaxID=2809028 RepID=A0ABS5UQF3_9BIFI|nr:energy-coupling factor ABC transporter permease [Bifidobacterium santillanense]MBT1173065.1 PDGLE domain-containing protein [Bifidobacterium santillanense]
MYELYEPQAATLAMHIPDNFISPSTGAVFWAVMIPIWVLCFRSMIRNAGPERMAYLGAGAAFSFLIMMFNVPTPGGTTAHGVGGALIALLLGPQYATVAVSVALLLQALLFGDGGLITLGANCFNMAVVLPFTAYGIYMGIRGIARFVGGVGRAGGSVATSGDVRGRGSAGAAGGRDDVAGTGSAMGRVGSRGRAAGSYASGRIADRVAVFLGGYIGLTLAALCVAVELGVQPMLFHDAAGRALYFPFPLAVTIPAMLIPHLAVAGVVEGLATVVVVDFVRRSAPEIVTSGIGVRGRGEVSVGEIAGPIANVSRGTSRPVSRETQTGVVQSVSRGTSGTRRPLWVALAIVALLSPLGLLATGDAWGEWGAEDFMAATGLDYVPQFIAHGFTWNTLLPDYSLAGLPDVVGYVLSAVIGIALTTIVFRLLALAVRGAGSGKVRRG